MKVTTRVRSAWKAMTSRSNISLSVLGEVRGDAGRACSIGRQQAGRVSVLRALDAPLDLAHRRTGTRRACGGRSGRAAPAGAACRSADEVEDALCGSAARRARAAGSSVVVVRRRGARRPARGLISGGIGVVGAAPGDAVACRRNCSRSRSCRPCATVLAAQLERGEAGLRAPSCCAAIWSTETPLLDVGAGGLPGVHAGEEGRRRRAHGRPGRRRARRPLLCGEAGQHEHVLAERRERLEDARQLERRCPPPPASSPP